MENFLKNDQIANFHSIRPNVLPSAPNTLILSEKERLFENFTNTYQNANKILKLKIL